MEQLKWTTPMKNGNERENTTNSPIIYKTPVKQYETNLKHTTYQSNMSCFNVLPNHITPPSGLTKFIARNPFESDISNRLHLSVISPTVFSKVSNSSQHSSEFAWSVDELALIQPAKIEEFPMQQIHCIDPETEIKAQAAIDQFFNENEIIPSPWEINRKEIRTKIEVDTPVRATSDLNSESSKSKKDGWSQTILTFPSELPSHVMEILKPYFTFIQEQNVESDDANSSNNSLRRKLFFNHEDCIDNDKDCLFPVEINESLVLSSSPPQSGMLLHGTPLKQSPNGNCYHDISQINVRNLSPTNISPIHSTINMSCESIKSRSRSVVRLNFTADMSIDQSNIKHKELTDNHSIDRSFNKINAEEKVDNILNLENNSMCIQVDTLAEIKVLEKKSTQTEYNYENRILELKNHNAESTFKNLTDSCKMNTNENSMFQQTNAILGISDQQSGSNSVQDAGYQTYSMSNTTNVIDSYNSSPVKQKVYRRDRILMTDDEFRLADWKENVKNIFSSTPSRSNRKRNNDIS
ncbi:PREDICTED: protein aurora borealis [Eufriesea mexicana]|uniref:protein aurora borealis n=1 Tax=Eufriesea mexicana TaxID=516756 RepID=UPI00083C1D03|nr:PREDICTED: protein aurora borealis [Eufriesea mexicana]